MNTYHLWLRPGPERIAELGGLHGFARWPHAITTDSGGFQAFSLAERTKMSEDGFEFDFAHDRIMLDPRTPIGKEQGGGFGPTVQLKDGTLVTSYSYRDKDDKTHLEVVRWKLPAQMPPSGSTPRSVSGRR